MDYRSEIKSYAKQRLSTQYGTTLGACLLASLPLFGAVAIPLLLVVLIAVAAILKSIAMIAVVAIIAYISIPFMLVGTYLLMPFSAIGIPAFMLSAVRGKREKATHPYTACKNYGKKLGGLMWQFLFLYLWSLPYQILFNISASLLRLGYVTAFVIGIILSIVMMVPTIIKCYSYAFNPYILNDCPNLTVRQALNLSKKMTKGIKGELFVFDLSFIGWWLLTALTCGILAVYTFPYYEMSRATLYESMKNSALASGKITELDLDPSLVCCNENYSQN